MAPEVPRRDNGDGTHELLYLCERAGDFTCVLRLDGATVKELDVTIVAGPVAAQATPRPPHRPSSPVPPTPPTPRMRSPLTEPSSQSHHDITSGLRASDLVASEAGRSRYCQCRG